VKKDGKVANDLVHEAAFLKPNSMKRYSKKGVSVSPFWTYLQPRWAPDDKKEGAAMHFVRTI
jgi:hypothetical protein